MQRYFSLWNRFFSFCSLMILLYTCCADFHLSLGRFGDSMSTSFRIISEIDIDLFVSFDLSVSIGEWANLSAISNLDLDIDVDTVGFRIHEIVMDIDQDGFDERLKLLAAVDDSDPSDYRIFIAWKGDEYTLDEGKCFLSWSDGDMIYLATSRCDQKGSVTKCRMDVEGKNSLTCEACDEEGFCTVCNPKGKIDDCKLEKQKDITEVPELDAGVSRDAEIDEDVEVQLSPCDKQLEELVNRANECNSDVSLAVQNKCDTNPQDVSICYSAYELADLFGQDTCSIIEDPYACGMVMSDEGTELSCERMFDLLAEAAYSCNATIQVVLDTKCEDSPEQVVSCFTSYDIARIAGEDICAILEEETVCSVMN